VPYPVLRIRDFYPSQIPDPGSRISDPNTATKERGKNISCHTFLCSHKFDKIENYFSFEMLKKKMWANFQRIIAHFLPKKLSLSSQKYGFGIWDPGPEIRDPEKTYSGFRIQGLKRHRILDPDPQHCTHMQIMLTLRLETRKQTVLPVSRTVERPVRRWRRLVGQPPPLLEGGGDRGGSEQGESKSRLGDIRFRGEGRGLWLWIRISTSLKNKNEVFFTVEFYREK
jgi:hypothetical protein